MKVFCIGGDAGRADLWDGPRGKEGHVGPTQLNQGKHPPCYSFVQRYLSKKSIREFMKISKKVATDTVQQARKLPLDIEYCYRIKLRINNNYPVQSL